MKLTLRAVAFGSFISAAGAVGLFAYPALGGESSMLWEVVEFHAQLTQAEKEHRRLQREDDQSMYRIAAKQEVVRDLVAGQMTFEDAVVRFLEVNRMHATAMENMCRIYPGASDEERAARQLIAHLRQDLDPVARDLGQHWDCVLTARAAAGH